MKLTSRPCPAGSVGVAGLASAHPVIASADAATTATTAKSSEQFVVHADDVVGALGAAVAGDRAHARGRGGSGDESVEHRAAAMRPAPSSR